MKKEERTYVEIKTKQIF